MHGGESASLEVNGNECDKLVLTDRRQQVNRLQCDRKEH